ARRLSNLASSGQTATALALLSSLWRERLPAAILLHSSNVLASGFEKTGQWQAVLQVLGCQASRQTAGAGGGAADVVSYGTAIHACGRGRCWELALGLLLGMHRSSIQRNTAALNAGIAAGTAAKGQWRAALQLVCAAAEMGLACDSVTATVALRACRGFGERSWKLALCLLTSLATTSVQLDTIAWNAALGVCERRQWPAALAVQSGMVMRGLTLSGVTFTVAMSACSHGGQWQQAQRLLFSLGSFGLEGNSANWNAAIAARAKDTQWSASLCMIG
ncbi:unnamed protein product, partial [Polarella glacialis]